jgi:hypothetical protein
METPTNTPQPYIINTGGSSSLKPILVFVGLGVASFFGYKAVKKYQENQAEKQLDTPEGQIAMQLKNVFEKFPVSDEDFRAVYLQVNSDNKDGVFKEYRLLTQRNLSDDIAKHIGKAALTHSVKTEAINSKKNGIIKIDANENINFLVVKGNKVVFTDPKPVTLYSTTKGLLWNLTATDVRGKISPFDAVKADVLNYKDKMIVDRTLLLPYDGIKLASDWTKYFRPLVNTHKVFAVVRVAILTKQKQQKYLWVDARDLSTYDSLKGLSSPSHLLL